MSQHSQRVVSLIEQVGRLMKQRVCDIPSDSLKLTVSQIMLLELVSTGEKMSMVSLAKALRVTPASATSIVDRLVQSGWLVRQSDESDRRKVWVRIADDRQRDWLAHQAACRERLTEFTNVLTESQRQQLADILQILVDRHTS